MKDNKVNKDKFPVLSHKEINQLAEELSNPNLEPQPFIYNWKIILVDKARNDKLVKEITSSIEEEKRIAYLAGREDAKKEIIQKIQNFAFI